MTPVSESRAGGCFGVASSPLHPPTPTSLIFDDVTANESLLEKFDSVPIAGISPSGPVIISTPDTNPSCFKGG
jgi:hypothetical protein